MRPLVCLFLMVAAASGQDALWHHRNLGKAFYENPATQKEAVEQFRQALALAPKSARERLNYGLALLKAGETKQAVTVLEQAQQQDPTLPHTWFNLGVIAKREGDYERALRQFLRLLVLVPAEPTAHHNLAATYKLLGQTAQATKEFEAARDLNPNLAAPHFQLYNAYRQEGRTADAARELAAFQQAKARDAGAPIPENMETNNYTEIYEVIDTAPVPPLSVRFVPETLARGQTGAAVLGSRLIWWSKTSSSLPLGPLQNVVSLVPGDFDNDGQIDVCVLSARGASLWRNAGARWTDVQPDLKMGSFRTALWIDYDHDYDLDLLLLGPQSALMRNNGDGTWSEQPFPFAPGEPTAATLFAQRAEIPARDFVVAYADHDAVLYRDDLNGKFTAVPLPGVPAATAITAADWNRTGFFDLAVETAAVPNTGEERYRFFHNADGGFKPQRVAPGISASASFALGEWVRAGVPEAELLLPFEENLAGVTATGEVKLYRRAASAEKTLRISLTGIKNLKSAYGATVEVKSGALYQKRIYAGTPLFFSMRQYPQADTVRITWPNGLIQNEPQQASGSRLVFKEAQRLSGSCPMIFTWNGTHFQFVTDVLGVAPLGASSADGQYFPVNHLEHIQIPGAALRAESGELRLRITEELREVSYLDRIELLAIDHAASEEIFTNDKFKAPPFPDFRLFGVSRKIAPARALDDGGRDLRSSLLHKDRVYPRGFARDANGVASLHHIDLDFGPSAPDGNAVLLLSGWVDWADGSTFLGASQRKGGGLVFPYLQVKDKSGRWQTVIDDMGIPAGKPKTIAVDLTGKFLSASREIRIVTNLCVYWDEIFLSEDSGPPSVRITTLNAREANLHFRGFSPVVVDPAREQPEDFHYDGARTLSNWNPTPGNYTRYGDVGELLQATDDKLLIMGSGDELELRFPASTLPALPAGWTRDYLLLVDGWAKDADANTAAGDAVEPLPFHGMSAYPYRSDEHFPNDAEHEKYQSQYLTRPALRLLRPLTYPTSAQRTSR